jgi:hypothetical protein
MLVTGVCALSVHSAMLQVLHVPFPDLSAITPPYRYLIRAIAMFGLIVLGQFTFSNLRGSFVKRWGMLFLVDAMLTETLFRGPFMDGYCTTAWVFSFVGSIPKDLTIALSSAIVTLAAPRLHFLWQSVIAAAIIAAFITYAGSPLIGLAMQPIMTSISRFAPQSEWCALPYGADVLIPAYLSFVEPVVACLMAAALVWNRLSKARIIRFAQFAVLVLALKNQLVTPFVYAAIAKLPALTALTSEGQFALEAATLAILTGVTWEWAHDRNARSISSITPA